VAGTELVTQLFSPTGAVL